MRRGGEQAQARGNRYATRCLQQAVVMHGRNTHYTSSACSRSDAIRRQQAVAAAAEAGQRGSSSGCGGGGLCAAHHHHQSK